MAGMIRRAWSALTYEASWLTLAAWKIREDHRGPASLETKEFPHE